MEGATTAFEATTSKGGKDVPAVFKQLPSAVKIATPTIVGSVSTIPSFEMAPYPPTGPDDCNYLE